MEKEQLINAEAQEETIEIDIFDTLGYIASKWYILLISGILAVAVIYSYLTFFVAPQYRSNITLNVENKREQIANSDISSSDIVAAESLAETYRIILTSNTVRDAVSDSLSDRGVKVSSAELKNEVSVSVIANTQILEINVKHIDPDVAYMIANTYEIVGPQMILQLTNWGVAYVVDHATMPKSPISPNVKKGTMLAFIVGIALSCIILLIIKFSDKRIYLAEDIEGILGITVIGQIPENEDDGEVKEPYHTTKKGAVL